MSALRIILVLAFVSSVSMSALVNGPAAARFGAASSLEPVAAAPGDAGADLIGRRAPEWSFERWIGAAPLSLAGLRGKVVLLRWWTDGCPYCAATLPALERLREQRAHADPPVRRTLREASARAVHDPGSDAGARSGCGRELPRETRRSE